MLVMESGEEKRIEKLVVVCMPRLMYPPGLQHMHALLWLAGRQAPTQAIISFDQVI